MRGCVLIFVEKSFIDCPKTTKLVKVFLLESFPLYGAEGRASTTNTPMRSQRCKVYLQWKRTVRRACFRVLSLLQ